MKPLLIDIIDHPIKSILFLGYSRGDTILIDKLIDCGCEVWHSDEKIDEIDDYDLVISFGYRHIINKELIKKTSVPIINLHISYLPWNRGAHPNFWAFYDGTPSGVTIHLIDLGIDTGPIIFQKKIFFNPQEFTFAQTYQILIEEIQNLFIEKIQQIINLDYQLFPQPPGGSYHKKNDLPKNFLEWDKNIADEINRIHLNSKE